MRLAPWFAFALIACGGSSTKTPDAPEQHPDAPVDMSIDAPDPRMGDFTLTGGANGLMWDAATSTIYFTDSDNDVLIKATDTGGPAVVGMFPAESAGISLGDIIKLADGTIITPNFGFGTQGTLFAMSTAGQGTALTGLDATRRRIGLTQDSAGNIYVAYFTAAMMMQQGGVGTITIASGVATESEIVARRRRPDSRRSSASRRPRTRCSCRIRRRRRSSRSSSPTRRSRRSPRPQHCRRPTSCT